MIRLLLAVRPRLVDEQPDAPGERVVVRHHDPAFTRGDVLALLQAEAADRTDRAHEPAVGPGEERLRAVLDQRHAVPLCDPRDAREVGRVPEQVRDDDRARAVADPGLDRLGRDVAGTRVDVREHGDRALVDDRCQCTHVGDGSCDDLVTGFGVDRGDRGVYGARARGCGDRVRGADQIREALLERRDHRALRAREHAALDDGPHRLDLVVTERAPRCILIRRERLTGRERLIGRERCAHAFSRGRGRMFRQ